MLPGHVLWLGERLSWPAAWLEQRGLTCSPKRYRALIVERLAAIAAQGDPARCGPFPDV